MKEETTYKLDQIADIWNYFILEYDFCKKKIKFTPEVQTNYFGDILSYFRDTFDIIFKYEYTDSSNFANQISFLQSIYVQQDFIEELLLIFKCGINKGHLKNDLNYSINREIRNELVGHPIRKLNGKFISSCLFGHNRNSEKIIYLRYHKDNNYEFESIEHPISKIIERHRAFLDMYFDKILNKLKKILKDFIKQIENIEILIPKKSLKQILNLSEIYFESIFKYDFVYDKESLLAIYARRDENKRYQNFIDEFYFDLNTSLREKKVRLTELIEPVKRLESLVTNKQTININYIDSSNDNLKNKKQKITYHYELGKIATKRNHLDFDFFGRLLKSKCLDNKLVIQELNHMKSHIHDEIEYYTALKLICMDLNCK